MVGDSLIYYQSPPPQASNSVSELPLLPGSDPLVLGAYRWTVVHSVSLQEVVRQLAAADTKARFRLLAGLSEKYDFTIFTTNDGYQIDIAVPVLAWTRCGDALEPWIASSLFLALEVVRKEKYRSNPDSNQHSFLQESIWDSFKFQGRVRKELLISDPVRLKDLPDGSSLYKSRFRPASASSGPPSRRPLPSDVHQPD